MQSKIKTKSLGGLTPQVSVSLLGVLLPYLTHLWRSLASVRPSEWTPFQRYGLFGSILILGAIAYALLSTP